MLENRITFDKSLQKKLLELVKNPISTLLLSIVVAAFFYFLDKEKKLACYYYTAPSLIAEKEDDSLKIFYGEKEVENVYYTNLILWNEGDNYIDYKNFIESKPIIFLTNDSIKVLSVNVNQKSRPDLNFQCKYFQKEVHIRLLDNEGIEKGDGVCFHILFTKCSERVDFVVKSRIKGNKKGFVFRDLNNFKKKDIKSSVVFLWIIIIILIMIRIITLVIFRKKIVFRKKELLFIVTYMLFTIYYTVHYLFFTTSLDWLN
jgi:hypothetical protein